MKQTLDQHIESGSLSSEINSSASQVDSAQPIITSPGNANPVAAAALENKDLAFLVAQLGHLVYEFFCSSSGSVGLFC